MNEQATVDDCNGLKPNWLGCMTCKSQGQQPTDENHQRSKNPEVSEIKQVRTENAAGCSGKKATGDASKVRPRAAALAMNKNYDA